MRFGPIDLHSVLQIRKRWADCGQELYRQNYELGLDGLSTPGVPAHERLGQEDCYNCEAMHNKVSKLYQ